VRRRLLARRRALLEALLPLGRMTLAAQVGR